MYRTEGIIDVDVGEFGQRGGERTSLCIVLIGLTGIEPQVLQKDHAAVGQRGDRCGRLWPDGVGGEDHTVAQQLFQALGHRSQ